MQKQIGTKENSATTKNNGLGPVAREKYESILHARVQKCIAAQESKIDQYRTAAFKTYLDQSGIADRLAIYRRTLQELIQFFGEPGYHSTPWLRDDKSLKQESKVQSGIEAVLRDMKELKSAFAELERLKEFDSEVAEKVWLAGAPGEIAELLKEIGEPSVWSTVFFRDDQRAKTETGATPVSVVAQPFGSAATSFVIASNSRYNAPERPSVFSEQTMTPTATVLIVSRDKATAHFCSTQLRARGYAVATVPNLRQSLARTKTHHLDALVVDLTSLQAKPDRISSQLRLHSLAPLVFIVRANTKLDGIVEYGSTVCKPIAARQLVTIVKSAIEHKQTHELAGGPFHLDLEKRVLTFGKKKIHLVKKEFAVLKLLMQHAGELVTRELLMREVWETDFMGDTRVIDVNIRWLRQKVEETPSEPRYLLTVRGQGYRFQIKEMPPR